VRRATEFTSLPRTNFLLSRKIHRMISKDLLEILVCPVCKTDLTLQGNPEKLYCAACHRVYPIRDGIPVLLIDEASVPNS
jgi:uncharacterized protein